jgi:hypothetical protein
LAEAEAMQSKIGPVIAASLIGILIGRPLGYIGDRFGRKKAFCALGPLRRLDLESPVNPGGQRCVSRRERNDVLRTAI